MTVEIKEQKNLIELRVYSRFRKQSYPLFLAWTGNGWKSMFMGTRTISDRGAGNLMNLLGTEGVEFPKDADEFFLNLWCDVEEGQDVEVAESRIQKYLDSLGKGAKHAN